MYFGRRWWLAHRQRVAEREAEHAAIEARADQQHAWVLAVGRLPRHRVSLPHRGRRSLEPDGAAALLNADQAAPGLTDEGQRADPLTICETLGNLWLAYPDATSAVCAKLTANMSHQQWRNWVSPDIDYIKVCPDLASRPTEQPLAS